MVHGDAENARTTPTAKRVVDHGFHGTGEVGQEQFQQNFAQLVRAPGRFGKEPVIACQMLLGRVAKGLKDSGDPASLPTHDPTANQMAKALKCGSSETGFELFEYRLNRITDTLVSHAAPWVFCSYTEIVWGVRVRYLSQNVLDRRILNPGKSAKHQARNLSQNPEFGSAVFLPKAQEAMNAAVSSGYRKESRRSDLEQKNRACWIQGFGIGSRSDGIAEVAVRPGESLRTFGLVLVPGGQQGQNGVGQAAAHVGFFVDDQVGAGGDDLLGVAVESGAGDDDDFGG